MLGLGGGDWRQNWPGGLAIGLWEVTRKQLNWEFSKEKIFFICRTNNAFMWGASQHDPVIYHFTTSPSSPYLAHCVCFLISTLFCGSDWSGKSGWDPSKFGTTIGVNWDTSTRGKSMRPFPMFASAAMRRILWKPFFSPCYLLVA